MLKNIMEKSKVALQSLKPTMLTPKALVIWAGAGLSFLVSAMAASMWINSSRSKKSIINNETQNHENSNNGKIPNNADNKAMETQVTEKLTSPEALKAVPNKENKTKRPAAAAKASVAAPVSGQITGNVITAASTTYHRPENNYLRTESTLNKNSAIAVSSAQEAQGSGTNKIARIVSTPCQAPINSNQMEPKSETMIKKPQSITLAVEPLAASSNSPTAVSHTLPLLKKRPRTEATAVPATAKLISLDDQKAPALHSAASSANADILSLLGTEERNKSQDTAIVGDSSSLAPVLQELKLGEKELRTKSKEEAPTATLIQLNTEQLSPLASNQTVNPSLEKVKALENLLNIGLQQKEETTIKTVPEATIVPILEQNSKTTLRAVKLSDNASTREKGQKGENQLEATQQAPMQTLLTSDVAEKQEPKAKKSALAAAREGVTVAKDAVSGALGSFRSKLHPRAEKLQAKGTKEQLSQASTSFNAIETNSAKDHSVIKAEEEELKGDKPSTVKTATSSIIKNPFLRSSSVKEKRSVAFTQDTQGSASPASNSTTAEISAELLPPQPPARGTRLNSQRAKAATAPANIDAISKAMPSIAQRLSTSGVSELCEAKVIQGAPIAVGSAETGSNLGINKQSITEEIPVELLSPPKPPVRNTSLQQSTTAPTNIDVISKTMPSIEKRLSSLEGKELEDRQAKQIIAISAEKAEVSSNLELNNPSTATTMVPSKHIAMIDQMHGKLETLINLPLENGKDSRVAMKAIQETYVKEIQKQIKELKLLIQAKPETKTLNKLEEHNDRLHKFLIDKKLEKYYNTAKANFSLLLEGKAIVEPDYPNRDPIYSFIALVYNVRALIKDCKKELWQVLKLDKRLLNNAKALCAAAEEIESSILKLKEKPKKELTASEKKSQVEQQESLAILNDLLLKIEEAQSAIFTLDPSKRRQACDKLTQICSKALENLPNLFKSDSIKKEAYKRSIKNVISIAVEIKSLVIAPTGDIKQLPAMKAEAPAITPSSSTSKVYSEPWDSKTSKTHLALRELRSDLLSKQEAKTLESNPLTPSISKRKAELAEARSRHTGRLDSPSTNMGQVPTALSGVIVEKVEGKQASRAVA